MATLANIKIKEPYYHREFENDNFQNSSQLTDCLNVALLIVPNLFKPLSKPIALGAGALRTWTSWASWSEEDKTPSQLFTAVVATTALTATFFGHPLGMLLTTAQDLGLEVSKLRYVLQTSQDPKKVIGHCLNIVNDALYLVIFFKGRLELTIASLALQILMGIYKSYDAFTMGSRSKGSLHLLTAAFRCHQLREQINFLNLIKKGSSFSLVKYLGSGGTGKVFLARRSDNTLIAVKEYYPRRLFEYDCPLCKMTNSFYFSINGINKSATHAFDIGRKLDHPNIVKILDQAVQLDDSENPLTYVMMEYVEQKQKPKDQELQGSIKNCLQLIDALKAGFALGYVYGDLYENNILIDSKGDLKLVDIDSFKKISTISDITNEGHLKEITSTMTDLLHKHEKYSEIKASLKAVIKNEELQMEGQRYISEKSPSKYFIQMFEKIAAVLNSFS